MTERHSIELRVVSSEHWAAWARTSPQYNFKQAPGYSMCLAELRAARTEFVLLCEGQQVLGGASLRVKRLAIPGAGIAYVSGGPLLATATGEAQRRAVLTRCLIRLAQEYVGRRQLTLRVDPPLEVPSEASSVEAFRDAGFTPSARLPRYRTLVVPLDTTEQELRARLDQKWRNQLNAALRKSPDIDVSRSATAVARFAPLLAATIERKRFAPELDAHFYDRVQKAEEGPDRLLVAIARVNGTDVAGVVASVLGAVAVYVLGATTETGMRSKAGYALQWTTMLEARRLGCRWYDLGGINPEANPNVYHFKRGFGRHECLGLGPLERRPSGIFGLMGLAVDHAYRVQRRVAEAKYRSTRTLGRPVSRSTPTGLAHWWLFR